MKTSRVGITELVLRDGHQSLIATRMKTEDMLPILEKMDSAGYFSLEMWGGATFDVCIRFLNEDPWERLRKIKKHVKKTKLQMLLRGQNVVGYKHYPDDILIKFIELAVKNGIDIFRIFDALNDIRNMETAIKSVKKNGAIAEGTISYTTSPVHTIDKYLAFAKELASLECDIICIKDMAGLLTPAVSAELTAALVKEVGLPVHVHSHTTGGVAQMSLYAAVNAGASYIDTCISPLSQGSSHTPTESMVAALKDTKFDTGIDLAILTEIAEYFQKIREKYNGFLDPIAERVDTGVLLHQIPGGMLSNLVSQLKEQNALDKYHDVLREVPKVRAELGYPPLVTPTSQIVGTQAVFNVILGERYKLVSKEVKEYVRGMYGRSPAPVDETVRKLAIGNEKPLSCRPADMLPPGFEKAKTECAEYAISEEDVISYALFPQVAMDFFKKRKSGLIGSSGQSAPAAQPQVKTSKIVILGEIGGVIGLQVGNNRYDIRTIKTGTTLMMDMGANRYEIDLNTVPAIRSDVHKTVETDVSRPAAPVNSAKKPDSSQRTSDSASRSSEKGAVVAPMPGKVVEIRVSEGQKIEKSDVLLVLEAMKMQNEITAPQSGVVREIRVEKGANVNGGAVLVIIG